MWQNNHILLGFQIMTKIKGVVLYVDESNWVISRNYQLYRFDP